MQGSLDLNHPKQKLLFFVAQDLDDRVRRLVADFVVRLATVRHWLIGPPHFVDIREEPKDTSFGDLPVETLGGLVEIYSAVPPWNLSREIDLQHLAEVKHLVNEVGDFSRQHSVAFEFELDGTFVGAIEDGEADRSLREGFIGEWERQLAITR